MVRRPHRRPGQPRPPVGSRGGGLAGPGVVVVGILIAAVSGSPAHASEVDAAALVEAVASLEEQAATQVLVTPELAAERFDNALFTFMIGEYEAAAEGTWAVRPFLAQGPRRQEADHVLAVSLFEIGATTLAERVNAEILAEDDHPFARDAAALQVQLFSAHRTPAEFATLYEELRARGLVDAATGSLAYAIGRAHWQLGRLEEATAAFVRVEPAEPTHHRARYHLAVIEVQKGDLAAATVGFRALRAEPTTEPAIAELATLALARIAYEEDRLDEASTLYRMFDPTSSVRATALEELAWTELRRGDLPAATLALEERLQLFPASAMPDVQATLGRLQLRFGAAEAAEASFLTAIATYEALLQTIPRMHADPDLPRLLENTELVLPADETWTIEQLRRDQRIRRAAHVQEVSRLADDGVEDTIELVRLLEDRLIDDPSTVRDRQLLAEATSRLLDLAEVRLSWAEERAQGSGRAAKSVREAVRATQTAFAQTRATLQRMDTLHGESAAETAIAAAETARGLAAKAGSVASAAPPSEHDDLERRLRGVITKVRSQVEARDGPVQTRLAEERRQLRAIAVTAQRVGSESERLWTRARALGTETLLARVDGDLEEVRSGLADASWARLSELQDERTRLADEHTAALSALDAAFELLRDRAR